MLVEEDEDEEAAVAYDLREEEIEEPTEVLPPAHAGDAVVAGEEQEAWVEEEVVVEEAGAEVPLAWLPLPCGRAAAFAAGRGAETGVEEERVEVEVGPGVGVSLP